MGQENACERGPAMRYRTRHAAWIGVYSLTIVISAAAVAFLISCQSCAPTGDRKAAVCSAPCAPPVQTTGQTTVLLYLKRTMSTKYGLLAHVLGRRDSTDNLTIFDPEKNWWERPAILYQETPAVAPDLTAGTECEAINGAGHSSNVEVALALTCHADVGLRTLPKSDCLKGTLTVTATTVIRYYDGRWTDVVDAKDRPLVFKFDTCDRTRKLSATGTDRRPLPICFECYTRGHQKWCLRSQWPTQPECGDVRTVFYAKDAKLEVTGYRYVAAPSHPIPHAVAVRP